MKVELIVVPDCPNEGPASALLRRAMDEAGLDDVTFDTTVVTTQLQAEARRFVGSPAFLINGRDPFAAAGAAPAVACRVYRTGQGLSGTPALADLVTALRASRRQSSCDS
ncbi:hypothetical protein [Lapillicoccus sp.]|uniref:hypothetical protein n=1 Tax=Lapillicoccus sp. TaxID=1909287 RepID=UPI0025FC4492|nr:hypothetical protein [Lapillicoccus sp.]